jgi:transposase
MSGRVEIITGPERRRRWSEEEKLQLVEEACRPGNSVSQVARLRGINASQLFGWRRQALAKGVVTDRRSEPGPVPALTFAAVEVEEEPATTGEDREVGSPRRRKATRRSSTIEIDLRSGDRVRVEGAPDASLVTRILSTLRRV